MYAIEFERDEAKRSKILERDGFVCIKATDQHHECLGNYLERHDGKTRGGRRGARAKPSQYNGGGAMFCKLFVSKLTVKIRFCGWMVLLHSLAFCVHVYHLQKDYVGALLDEIETFEVRGQN